MGLCRNSSITAAAPLTHHQQLRAHLQQQRMHRAEQLLQKPEVRGSSARKRGVFTATGIAQLRPV